LKLDDLQGLKIAYAVTGSFCTHKKSLEQAVRLRGLGASLIPVLSEKVQNTDTRFGRAKDFAVEIERICERGAIRTIDEAEPLGPKKMCDIVVVAPCTGNHMAKLANSITDGVVTLAVKSHIRGGGAAVICAATNDALAGSAKNIGILMNLKPYYFVPLAQDDYEKKPTSLVADFSLLPETILMAMRGKQIQPLFTV